MLISRLDGKTHQEKSKSDEEIKLEKMKEADSTNKEVHLSNITKFLESEWVSSTFKTDYILTSQLHERYQNYCKEKNIGKISRGNIVGAPELEFFGAEFKDEFSHSISNRSSSQN